MKDKFSDARPSKKRKEKLSMFSARTGVSCGKKSCGECCDISIMAQRRQCLREKGCSFMSCIG